MVKQCHCWLNDNNGWRRRVVRIELSVCYNRNELCFVTCETKNILPSYIYFNSLTLATMLAKIAFFLCAIQAVVADTDTGVDDCRCSSGQFDKVAQLSLVSILLHRLHSLNITRGIKLSQDQIFTTSSFHYFVD